MDVIRSSYEQIEARFTDWAQARPDIHAAIVVGSRARHEHRADAWSDLDIILFVQDPAPYVTRADWLAEMGEVWVAALERTGPGDPEWVALYAGGLKLDVVLATERVEDGFDSLSDRLKALPYQNVLRRGFRVLVDRHASHAPVVPRSSPTPAHPSAAELTAAINGFLLDAVRAAKFLRRGDLWRASQACDIDLRPRLLAMLEWHARAVHGLDHDVWYGGRFLEEWADPQAVRHLPATFATYEAGDIGRALMATLELYARLARETAARLGYTDPSVAVSRVTAWIRSTL